MATLTVNVPSVHGSTTSVNSGVLQIRPDDAGRSNSMTVNMATIGIP